MDHKNKISVLFDCDGTLLKSLGLGMQAYNYALEKVGARFHGPDEIKKFFGRSADRIFLQLLGNEEKAFRAYEYYLEMEERQVSKIVPHEGIVDLLSKLKNLEIKLGVVTGRHARELDFLLRENDLTKYFDVFICDNELSNSKPHPEGLYTAHDKLGTDPALSYYIGDSVMDIQAATRAGSQGIAAIWDEWARPLEMQKESPVFMAKDPSEIAFWLQKKIN